MADFERKPRRVWRTLLIVAGLVVVVGVAFVAFSPNGDSKQPETAAAPAAPPALEILPEETVVLQPRDLTRAVRITGSLAPVTQSIVKSEVAAQVREVLVREGEVVKKGQVIARLDTADLQQKLNERSSALRASEAQLEMANTTLNNSNALLSRRVVSPVANEQAQSQHRVAAANVEASRAQVAQARKALAEANIVAPIGGIIGTRAVNGGDRVGIDGRIVSIVDLSVLEFQAAVPASDIPQVQLGQTVEFRVEGFGERQFTGTVSRINPTASEGSRSFLIFIRVANSDLILRGGMYANGDLVIWQRPQVLAVPTGAVRGSGAEAYVYKIAGETIVRQKVTTGTDVPAQGIVEVTEGLVAGDRVIIAPLTGLTDGSRVKIAAR